jgi:hypothetical protein
MTRHKSINRRQMTHQPLRNLVKRITRALRLQPTEDAADTANAAITAAERKKGSR